MRSPGPRFERNTHGNGDPKDVEALQVRAGARVMDALLLAAATVTRAPDPFRYTYPASLMRVNGQSVAVGDGTPSSTSPNSPSSGTRNLSSSEWLWR